MLEPWTGPDERTVPSSDRNRVAASERNSGRAQRHTGEVAACDFIRLIILITALRKVPSLPAMRSLGGTHWNRIHVRSGADYYPSRYPSTLATIVRQTAGRHNPPPGPSIHLSLYVLVSCQDADVWSRPLADLKILFIVTVNNDSATRY